MEMKGSLSSKDLLELNF